MIDTEQVNNIKQPLQLINVDFKHFVKNNQPIMQNYIDSLEHTRHKIIKFLPKELNLSLDEDGYLALSLSESSENKKRYGIKKSVQQIYRRGNETNADWAKRVMINYRNWLRPYYKQQANLTSIDELEPISSETALFTNHSYINWLISQMNDISGYEINSNFTYDQHEYLLKSFIANYNQFKTIHRSLLHMIIEYNLNDDRHKFEQDPVYWTIFVQKLLDILNNKNNAPKVVITTFEDEYDIINYAKLLKACQKLHINVNELPIEALFELCSAEKVDSKLTLIKFKVRDLNDIKAVTNLFRLPDNLIQTNIKDLDVSINSNGYGQAIKKYLTKLSHLKADKYYQCKILQTILQLADKEKEN